MLGNTYKNVLLQIKQIKVNFSFSLFSSSILISTWKNDTQEYKMAPYRNCVDAYFTTELLLNE